MGEVGPVAHAARFLRVQSFALRTAFLNRIGLCPDRDWKYLAKLVALLKPRWAAMRAAVSSLWARRRLASSMTRSSMSSFAVVPTADAVALFSVRGE